MSSPQVAIFSYDGSGNLVSAEPGSRRKLLAKDRSRSLRDAAPVDFASLQRAYSDASKIRDLVYD